MSDKKWTLFLEIMAGNRSLQDAVRSSQSSVSKFKAQAKRDIDSVGRAWNSAMGKAAAIGVGLGVGKLMIDSAKLERSLTRTALSSGRTKEEAKGMKEEIESLGIKTGQSSESLEQAFKTMVSLTGSWDVAKQSLAAVNTAMAVTDVSAEGLGQSLAIASEAFHIDLNKPQAASDLLNKMAAMGKGAGGLSNVAKMFSEISLRASMAGMGADSALQFIGMIGNVTKNPAQMDAVAESTLRMFTNIRALGRMRGVKIFDDSGKQRDPLLILKEVGDVYKKLGDKDQARLLNKLFNGDARAMMGLQAVFNSGALDKLAELKKNMDSSTGGLEKKGSEGLNNMVDQAARLKNLLEKAADSFVNPINKAIADVIQYGMDKQGLNGKQIAELGTAGILTAWLGGRMLKGAAGSMINKLLGSKVGLAGGVAEGALMSKMGVTPVYVVNFSEMGGMAGLSSAMGIPDKNLAAMMPSAVSMLPWMTIAAVALPSVAMIASAYFANQKSMEKRQAEKDYKEKGELKNAETGEVYYRGSKVDPYNLKFEDDKKVDEVLSGPAKPKRTAEGIPIFNIPATINHIYIDGKMVNNVRTVTTGRGRFHTNAVLDGASPGGDE